MKRLSRSALLVLCMAQLDLTAAINIGNYASEIDSYIANNPVPEPHNFGIAMGLLALGLASLRRR